MQFFGFSLGFEFFFGFGSGFQVPNTITSLVGCAPGKSITSLQFLQLIFQDLNEQKWFQIERGVMEFPIMKDVNGQNICGLRLKSWFSRSIQLTFEGPSGTMVVATLKKSNNAFFGSLVLLRRQIFSDPECHSIYCFGHF